MNTSVSPFPISRSPTEIGFRTPAAEAIERINAQRVADGEMKTNAVQIWVQMAHRLLALLIAAAVGFFAWKARRSARVVRLWSWLWIAMILLQIGLGRLDDLVEARRQTWPPPTWRLGALSLLVGAVLAFRLFCGARIRDFVLPDGLNRGLIERVA